MVILKMIIKMILMMIMMMVRIMKMALGLAESLFNLTKFTRITKTWTNDVTLTVLIVLSH